MPRYQNASDINAVNITSLSQNAKEVQRDSDTADKPVTVRKNNNSTTHGSDNRGDGSDVVGGDIISGDVSLGRANIANSLLNTTIASPNTIVASQQQQQQQQQQSHNPHQDPYPNSPYRSDSAEEQYVAEQVHYCLTHPPSKIHATNPVHHHQHTP